MHGKTRPAACSIDRIAPCLLNPRPYSPVGECVRRPSDTRHEHFNYDDGLFSFTLRNNFDALNAVSSVAKSFFGADGQRKQVTL
jgi:hypothetical protein